VLLLDPMSFSLPEGVITGKLTLTLHPGSFAPGAVLDEMMLAVAFQSAGFTLELMAS
jgi:hypothetical protein